MKLLDAKDGKATVGMVTPQIGLALSPGESLPLDLIIG